MGGIGGGGGGARVSTKRLIDMRWERVCGELVCVVYWVCVVSWSF